MGHRWLKFWPQDWEADPCLKVCSLAARGLWIAMISLMHQSPRYGHLLVNGRPPDTRRLASVVGAPEREVTKLLAELEGEGVFSRDDAGIIFSRRMVRDTALSEEGATSIERRWGKGEASGKTRSERLAEARKKGTHTAAEWQSLLNIFGGICPRCNRSFEDNRGAVRDHIIPIYQGGSDAIDNIQALCVACNASKGPDTTDHRPPDWRSKMSAAQGDMQGVERLEKRLGYDGKTPTQEADTESEERKSPPLPPAARRPRRKAGLTALEPDWRPDAAGREFAEARGVTPAELPRFVNHHLSKGSLMADWNAAWRTWCLNAVKFARSAPLLSPEGQIDPVSGRRNSPMSGMA